jgi:hypothetical protein
MFTTVLQNVLKVEGKTKTDIMNALQVSLRLVAYNGE